MPVPQKPFLFSFAFLKVSIIMLGTSLLLFLITSSLIKQYFNPTPTADDLIASPNLVSTENWQTFQSTTNNFKFKHPADWQLTSSIDGFSDPLILESVTITSPSPLASISAQFLVSSIDSKTQIIKQFGCSLFIVSDTTCQAILINGQTFYKFSTLDNNLPVDSLLHISRSKLFLISAASPHPSLQNQHLIDTLFSTITIY